jgi:hypothetical protein
MFLLFRTSGSNGLGNAYPADTLFITELSFAKRQTLFGEAF